MDANNQAIVEINQLFYQAFHDCDLQAMENVWSNKNPVSVTHPGWPIVHGLEQVMSSWQRILQSANTINISISNIHVNVVNEKIAHVTNLEHLDNAVLAASNLYLLENDGWRMLYHQATPVQVDVGNEEKPLIH